MTTTYYLRVVLVDNSVVTQSITVNVEAVAGPPAITRFTVDPKQLTTGQCVNVKWTVEGQVTDIYLTAPPDAFDTARGDFDLIISTFHIY